VRCQAREREASAGLSADLPGGKASASGKYVTASRSLRGCGKLTTGETNKA